jgi:fibro-slime domain-containing protein
MAKIHFLPLTLLVLPFACGKGASDSDDGSMGGSGANTGTGGVGLEIPGGGGEGTGTGGKPAAVIEKTLPKGFTKSEGAEDGSDAETLRGGYRLVGKLADNEAPSSASCANVLRVLIRDFVTYDHPDFGGSKDPSNALGLVETELAKRKPVRSDAYPSVASQFEDWYANVDGTNVPYLLDLWLEPEGESFIFDSSRFFPLDSLETSESKQNDGDGNPRNFGFTTELHTAFAYKGGEVFTFRGDDDVFVFINNKLVVDLGGVHSETSGSIEVDTLELEVGKVYNLDLFQAERNPVGSNFRIETTLDFTECGEILPDDVVK